MSINESTKTLHNRYAELESFRSPFLERARECSKLSIPSLIPPTDNVYNTDSGSLHVPWQSMAARCVNNLASKLMLTLLPPNMPFFRLVVTAGDNEQDPELKSEVDRGLAKIERTVIEHVSAAADRVVIHEALKHLIVGGNALLYLPDVSKNTMAAARCFHLSDYVIRRAPNGTCLEIIVKETVSYKSLPEKLQATLKDIALSSADTGQQSLSSQLRTVDLYTGITLNEKSKRWEIRQECGSSGVLVPGSAGTYPLEACPWIPMRFIRVDGEAYGRSYVEEYYGDIKSLDALYEALVEGSAAAAKVIFLINPNSTTRAEDLSEAPNLGFVAGNREDVNALQLEKYGDFRIAKEMVGELERRLAHAFILNSAVQRDGERVTAEEIRRMVEDLEAALGGVYSLMAVEFQMPYVKVRLKQLEGAGVLPALPEGVVKPAIVTGVEALGRGNDKTRLQELGQFAQSLFGPEVFAKLINPTEYLRRLATSLGIDGGGLLVSEEELTERSEQDMAMQMMNQLGPDAMKMMGNMSQNDPAAMAAAVNSIEMPPEAQEQQ